MPSYRFCSQTGGKRYGGLPETTLEKPPTPWDYLSQIQKQNTLAQQKYVNT